CAETFDELATAQHGSADVENRCGQRLLESADQARCHRGARRNLHRPPADIEPARRSGRIDRVRQPGRTRAVGSTIFVLPTADVATESLNKATQALGTVIKGATAHPAPVGANGTTASGRSPDGSKAVTVVMFTEGRTFAVLKFDAVPGDAIPAPLTAQ